MIEPASSSVSTSDRRVADFSDPSLYINREVSWLQFNSRVLEEAEDDSLPLLERVKFLSIFFTNLDEFFMIRVSGLREQLTSGVQETPPDGMTPAEQVAAIGRMLQEQLVRAEQLWNRDLTANLSAAGIRLLHIHEVSAAQRQALRAWFIQEPFPTLTPLAFDPTHPFPHISNLSLNLAVIVEDPERGTRFARIKVPDLLPRLIPVPEDDSEGMSSDEAVLRDHGSDHPTTCYVWMEDLIAANLDLLFRGMVLRAWYPFRITRDADLEIEEDEAGDLLAAVEEQIDLRHFGSVVRLELPVHMPDSIRDILVRNLQVASYQVQTSSFRLGMADLMELVRLERPDLKFPLFQPAVSDGGVRQESPFSVIQQRDVLLYHPYQSFLPVVEFVRAAAKDPRVLAIKQTLYRVGPNSPIVESLMEARQNGKQVAVLLELKARFDEENNIEWARKLEDEGVHVVYGVMGLKTHAKLCMVVRRDEDGIRRYVHMGTGNYNPTTSRIYTDFSLMTADPNLSNDVADLFNTLTGYSRNPSYEKLLIAPHGMREQLLARIDREIARQRRHRDGYLAFKMNALVDQACIRKLYEASQAGVRIELLVRGICCLRPGVAGVSETVRVRSIVGRFLEHSRLYYFRNGGEEELLLGSADLMPRNLDRRVEVLFPIQNRILLAQVMEQVFRVNWRDTRNARELETDGTYRPVGRGSDEPPFCSQEELIQAAKEGRLFP